MQVEKPCPLVSSCFFIFLQIEKSLPSLNLAAKFSKLAAKRIWNLARTWHKRALNLAVIKYHASGISLIVVHGDLRLLNNSTC